MRSRLKILTFALALALSARLGSVPLIDADEGRNAEVGREMAASNDYVLPRLNALPYLDKPIVYFAAEAAAMEVLGPTETAARLPAYLFTLATALLVFFFARRVFDADRAWIATSIFLATPLTIAFARTVIFDSALTFFITAATMAFYLAIETPERRWSIVAWIAIGFGILTKGPVAIVLPLFVAVPHSIRRRRFGAPWPPIGIVACAAIVAPWVWAVMQQVPDFFQYVVVTETAARLATSELQRTGPPWYFLPYLVGGALPWSIVLVTSWREVRGRHGAVVYLLLWVIVPLVFFSLSQSKRPQYILPLMVPVALLAGAIWQEARTRIAAAVLAAFGALLLVLTYGTKLAGRLQEPEMVRPAMLSATLMGVVFLIGGALALSKRRDLALAALAIPMIALPLVGEPVQKAIALRRSSQSFARKLEPHLTPATRVIGIEAFTGSLIFYLRRPVFVASPDGSEWTSNYILRRYERYAANPASTLKPLGWAATQAAACCAPTVFIARNHDADAKAMLESRGLREIARSSRLTAYSR
ncbi:MAG TPA: glycosyltransferase family 39 protein [Thermoanaerobaculia bacterium]